MENKRRIRKDPSKPLLTVARYLRNFRGMSMLELSDQLGLPYRTVFNLEHNGKANLGTLRRFAAFYDVPLDCLARNNLSAIASTLNSPAIRSNRARAFLHQVQKRREEIGDCGERLVIERERERLTDSPYALAVNGNVSDDLTAGFDILSFTQDGVPIYIEVKSTVQGKDEVFFMSRGEIEFAQRCQERGLLYQLHRVYKLNEKTNRCSVYVLSADDLLRDYEFIPVSYQVRRKVK